MKDLIEKFSDQLKTAASIADTYTLPANEPAREIREVVIAGLGGSAFGGEITRKIAEGQAKVPVQIFRSYTLPAHIGPHTLVIISSYSGNTEETLEAFHHAINAGAMIVCITSGGKIADIAKNKGFDLVTIPGGYPPRAAAGLSFVQQLSVLHARGIIADYRKDLNEAILLLENFNDHAPAENLAKLLKNKIPVLYSSDLFEPAAIRWRQQINENSKQLCWHHVIPEMNHNELVGWIYPKNLMDNLQVILLRSRLDYERTALRFDINKEIISKSCNNITEVFGKGESLLAQMVYLLHLGDWVSWYLALENEVDPTPVAVIDFLKGELAKQ
jgi:glucose/mannose-6-phosphate isomerase